jgi:hypothetical protein
VTRRFIIHWCDFTWNATSFTLLLSDNCRMRTSSCPASIHNPQPVIFGESARFQLIHKVSRVMRNSIPCFAEDVLTKAQSILPRFLSAVLPIPYEANGILLSEGLAFCAACDLNNVDLIIESGVAGGRSTEIWAKYSDWPIVAIDHCGLYGRQRMIETKTRLARHLNIAFDEGDSWRVIPALLDKHRGHNIAVFIDGPKGEEALSLAEKCLTKFPSVKILGIHDMCVDFSDHMMSTRMPDVFYSDDQRYRQRFAFVDAEDNEWLFSDGTQLGAKFPNGFVVGISQNRRTT